MAATLHVLRPQSPPLAGFLRIGHTARHAVRLKITDEQVMAAVGEAKVRLVRLRDALADLQETGSADTRSRVVGFRGGAKAVSVVLGR